MLLLGIERHGARELQLKLAAFANPKLPFLESTMRQAADIFTSEIRQRAVGGIKAKAKGGYVRHKGGQILATVTVTHPGARSAEFGRTTYYGGFKGNNRPGSKRARGSMKQGYELPHVRGQAERVFVGIRRGDAAIAASQARVEKLFVDAVMAAWEQKQGGV